ncbi:MAG: hypothetical protein ABL984_14335 [Pyrinomonadaceae bacterium]
MTKLLGVFLTLFAATIVHADQNYLVSDQTVFNIAEMNCLAGDVLNCMGGADGHHIYEKETECPVGGEKFKARYLGTHSTFGRHLDWEPVSYMRFPVPLPVCPSNGLIVAEEKYSKEESEKLKKVVESKTYKDLYAQKHATYYLFAKIKELNAEKYDDYWWLYLNATWEADNCKNKVRYKEYALEVISAGNKRLTELKDSEQLHWVLKVITADMHRRIGDFKSSQELVDKFGTPSLSDKDANEYFLLAKKLLQKAIKDGNTDRVEIKDAAAKTD